MFGLVRGELLRSRKEGSEEGKSLPGVVVIGTGFGGTMTALPIAENFRVRAKGEKIVMLERGTWWTTSVSTVQDKEIATADLLRDCITVRPPNDVRISCGAALRAGEDRGVSFLQQLGRS